MLSADKLVSPSRSRRCSSRHGQSSASRVVDHSIVTDADILNAIENGFCVVCEELLIGGEWVKVWRCAYDIDKTECGKTLREAATTAILKQRAGLH